MNLLGSRTISYTKPQPPQIDTNSLLASIASKESGGQKDPYRTLTATARKAGEYALGKYQIVNTYLQDYAKQAGITRPITEKEFLSNPQLQDQIAGTVLTNDAKKYGMAGAVSKWFSGSPDYKRQVTDRFGTTPQKYVNDVLAKLPTQNGNFNSVSAPSARFSPLQSSNPSISLKSILGNTANAAENVPDFIPDSEIGKYESSGSSSSTPDFIPDSEISKYETPVVNKTSVPGTGGKFEVQPEAKFIGDVTGITGILKGLSGPFKGQPLSQSLAQAGAGAAKLGLTVGTLGTEGVAAGIGGRLGTLARSAEAGITGAAFQALDNIEKQNPISKNVLKTGAATAAIPLIGAGIKSIGGPLKSLGQKIQTSVIKPSKADILDGFKVENINKYSLGGSPKDTLEKSQALVTDLAKQLNTKLKSTEANVDLMNAFQATRKQLTQSNKFSNFGSSRANQRVLDGLLDEIKQVSGNGIVPLPDAQLVKQASGAKGSWVFGSPDPDASSIEKVYTTFYRNLKQDIEKAAPPGIKEINQKISEIIPIINASIRRIPVAERNSVLGLNDMLSLGFTAINPKAAALYAINKLSKSGGFGAKVANTGEKLSNLKGANNVTKRIFGR